MLLAELVATSRAVAQTRSRDAKAAALAACLRRLDPGERKDGIAWLSGELPQGRLGVGFAALGEGDFAAAAAASLTLPQVADLLDQLAATGGTGSRQRRAELLRDLMDRATAEEQHFLRRLLLQELRQGALEGIMVEALAAAGGMAAAAVRRALLVGGSLPAVGDAALPRQTAPRPQPPPAHPPRHRRRNRRRRRTRPRPARKRPARGATASPAPHRCSLRTAVAPEVRPFLPRLVRSGRVEARRRAHAARASIARTGGPQGAGRGRSAYNRSSLPRSLHRTMRTSETRRTIWMLCLAAGLVACGSEAPPPAAEAADALAPAPAEGANDWFVDRAAAAGLDFVHFNGMSGDYYFPEIMPAGVGLLDYDNDGDLDAYFVQGQMMGDGKTLDDALFEPVGPLPLRGRLYRNDLEVAADGSRTLRFTDVTEESGVDARGHGMGVATGDVDNDGWVDLYLTFLGANRLYRNNGDDTFTDVSAASGTDDAGWGVSASFVDIDRDGWLDLYVGNYVHYDFSGERICTVLSDRRSHCGPEHFEPETDRLFRNRGNGTFEDVTATAFIVTEPFGPALGVSTADFDGDGWMDIYVANDGRDNLLWMNRGDGTFGNLGLMSGAALSEHGKPEASMGVDAGDFDNDGDEDLIMTHLPTEGHNLYVNDGSGLFEDGSAASRVHGLSLGYTGWGTSWIDVDNDGWLDILLAHGALDAKPGRPESPMPFEERNLVLRNTGDGRFQDVTDQGGAALALVEVSRGAAFGDIDNDGDTDALLGNLNGRVRLLVNNVGNRAHWLGLRIAGEPPAEAGAPAVAAGRDMLGARVEVLRDGEVTLRRRVRADGSYASASDPRVLVGLGDSIAAPAVRVHWPEGGTEEWTEVAIDRWTTLTRGEGTAR